MANIPFSAVISVSGTSSQIDSSGGLYPVMSISNNPVLPGTGSVGLPEGNTAARSGAAGAIRFNTQTTVFEGTLDGAAWFAFLTSGGTVNSVTGTSNRITASPTTGDVIVDIAATYVGQTSITTLGTVTTGTWNATTVASAHGGTGFSTYALGDIIYSSATNVLSKLAGNTTSGIQYLAQTGTGAVSAAPVWTTISGGDITGAALTKTDDTNVTLTLGGTPSTALLRATSLTLGWTGQLGLTRGGTAASLTASNGGIVYSTASALAILSGTATAGQALLSGASTTPVWSTPTYPAASGSAGKILRSDGTNNVYSTSTFADTYSASTILYSNGANTVTGLATANSAVLTTGATGVPVLTALSTDGQVIIGSSAGAPVAATLSAGSGVTITNGHNSITIAATGSGGTVTSVSGTANEIDSTGGTTPVISITSNAILPGTGGVTLPQGNTAARAGGAGTIRLNTQAGVFESTTDGATWATIETSAVGVISVSGTTNRITATPTTGLVVVDISASYVGQTSMTTLGTIGTGVWQGSVVALAYGGTNANLTASNGGIFYSTASAGAILSGTSTANQLLLSGASTTPAWSTSTYPATNAINTLLYASSANVMAALATANNGVLTTGTSGTPVITALGTDGQLIIGSSAGAPVAATISAGTGITVTNGHNSITIAASGSSSPIVALATLTASNSASLEFLSLFSASYYQYLFVFNGILPATNATILYCQIGDAGGYKSTNYVWAMQGGGNGTDTNTANDSDAQMVLSINSTYTMSNAKGNYAGQLMVSGPNGGSTLAQFTGYASYNYNSGSYLPASVQFGGNQNPAATFTKIKFYMSSGNITSGTIDVFGIAAG